MIADLDWVDAKLADLIGIDPVDCHVIAEQLSKELRTTRMRLAALQEAGQKAADAWSARWEYDEFDLIWRELDHAVEVSRAATIEAARWPH